MIKIESGTIISTISRTLKDNFPEFKIYKDKVKQGLKKPCFFIFQLNSDYEKKSQLIFERNLLINVRFHSDFTRIELDEIEFKLLNIFSKINQGDLILIPRKLNCEIQDDILQVFITYKLRLFNENNSGDKMQNIKINN